MKCNKCFEEREIICRGFCKPCYEKIRQEEFLSKVGKKKCECDDPSCTEMIPITDITGRYRKYAKGHNKKSYKRKTMGYIILYKPNHPNSNIRGFIYEHRFIMSEYLDRPLEKDEVVHHINGNKKDNRIENLVLFNNNKKHLTETTRKPPKDIRCEICDSDTTYIDKEYDRPIWRPYGESFICGYCFKLYWEYTCFGNKDISDYNKRPRKDFSDRVCLICGGKTTVDKRGYERWRHYKNGVVCHTCEGKVFKYK